MTILPQEPRSVSEQRLEQIHAIAQGLTLFNKIAILVYTLWLLDEEGKATAEDVADTRFLIKFGTRAWGEDFTAELIEMRKKIVCRRFSSRLANYPIMCLVEVKHSEDVVTWDLNNQDLLRGWAWFS